MLVSRRFATSLLGKAKPVSYHANQIVHNQTKALSGLNVDNDKDKDDQVNKIPNIKGFEFLRNPKLNKVHIYI